MDGLIIQTSNISIVKCRIERLKNLLDPPPAPYHQYNFEGLDGTDHRCSCIGSAHGGDADLQEHLALMSGCSSAALGFTPWHPIKSCSLLKDNDSAKTLSDIRYKAVNQFRTNSSNEAHELMDVQQ
jgi:hypothetical protein